MAKDVVEVGSGGGAMASIRARIEQILADSWSFFLADLRGGPHAAVLQDAQRATILERTSVLMWMSVAVMPTAVGSFCFLYAGDQLVTGLSVVAAAIGAVFVLRQVMLAGAFDRHYHWAMVLLVGGIFGPVAALVLQLTRDSQADYFFAFFLIFFAFTALFPADVSFVLMTSAWLVASYLVAALAFGGSIFDPEVSSGLIYLSELTFIGVVLNRVLSSLFFDERRNRIALEEANSGLRELDRAKSAFFANMSHELRTPLTLIITPLTHVLRSNVDLADDVRGRLQGMRGNAMRLLRTVNMLLDFSRVEAGQARVELGRFEVEDLVRYVASLFEGTARQRGVSLDVPAAARGVTMVSDPEKVEHILVNLVGNALKFTPEGGRITLSAALQGDEIRFTVQDTGVGIAREHQELVFDRFGQVAGAHQASVKGTGIGLSMVRELARALGGNVTLESEVGVGSTFTVCLPRECSGDVAEAPLRRAEDSRLDGDLLTADVAREVWVAPPQIAEAGEHASWVMICDDNPSLLELVSTILRPFYNLRLAGSGEEALQRIGTEHVDLLLSDVMMPGMTGLELCSHLRAQASTRILPIILLTARGGSSSTVEGLEHGADDYIGKPFDPDELLARVRAQFEKQAIIQDLEAARCDLEGALSRLKAEEVKLVASEKLRTLGDLSAGIFHELHNYLNMIHNGALPLKDGVEDLMIDLPGEVRDGEIASEIVELVDLIVDASVAALGITGELKVYAHQGGGADQPFDLHALIRSNIRMFGRFPDGITVRCDLTEEPITLIGVPSRLVLLFTNLVKNALEAMDGQGELVIATRREAGEVEIRVTDTGPGVAPEHRAKLFEPFHTTKPQGQGLGLGLSLASKVIHELGGDIRYDETWQQGACFLIRLPLPGTAVSTANVPRDDEEVPA